MLAGLDCLHDLEKSQCNALTPRLYTSISLISAEHSLLVDKEKLFRLPSTLTVLTLLPSSTGEIDKEIHG